MHCVESQNQSLRNLKQMSLSSRSFTKQYIIIWSQAMADQNYNASLIFKMCKKVKSTWFCWYFNYILSNKEKQWPMLALPCYHHVPNIILKRKGQSHFLWCDCGYFDSIGIPCAHIFQVVREMSLNMFHNKHWRYYKADHNDSSDLGQQIVQAQMEHFANKGMGVCLLLYQ